MRCLLLLLLLVAPAWADNFVTHGTVIALPASTTAQFMTLNGIYATTATVGAAAGNASYVTARPVVVWRLACAADVSPGGAFNRVFTMQTCATTGCAPADFGTTLACTIANSCTVPACTCNATLATGQAIVAGARLVIKVVASSASIAVSNATCDVEMTSE